MSGETNRQRLDGKVAIVTGATGGIGEATAKLFLELGAKVMLVARSPDKLSATLARLQSVGDVAGSVAEAHDEQAVAAAVAATQDRFGGLDILIANAGTEGALKPIEALSVEEFEDTMRTNVTGVWLSMKHCVAPLKGRGGGSIVALSSIAGCIGFPAMAPYIASKHAVYGLVKTAALELGPSNIRVNTARMSWMWGAPVQGYVQASAKAQGVPEKQITDAIAATIPLRRLVTDDECARAALMLLSDYASAVTGATLDANGGEVMA